MSAENPKRYYVAGIAVFAVVIFFDFGVCAVFEVKSEFVENMIHMVSTVLFFVLVVTIPKLWEK